MFLLLVLLYINCVVKCVGEVLKFVWRDIEFVDLMLDICF
jgi:hypothetical protein